MNEVRELREKLNLSQQSFAERLGVGIASVSRWERGAGRPSKLAMMRVNQLADELGLARPFEGPPFPKKWGVRWPGRKEE